MISSLKKTIEQLSAENATLKKNSHSHLEYQQLSQQLREQRAAKKSLEDELELAKKSIAAAPLEIKAELDKVEKILRLERGDRRKEKSQLERCQRQLAELELRCLDLQQQTEAKSALSEELESRLRAADDRERRLNEHIRQIDKDKHRLESECKQQKQTLQEMQTQMSKLNELIDRIQQKHQSQQQQLDVITQERDEARRAIEQVEQKVQERESQVNQHQQLVNECERLRAENADFRRELAAFDAEFFDEVDELRLRYQESVKQVASLQKLVERQQADIARLSR